MEYTMSDRTSTPGSAGNPQPQSCATNECLDDELSARDKAFDSLLEFHRLPAETPPVLAQAWNSTGLALVSALRKLYFQDREDKETKSFKEIDHALAEQCNKATEHFCAAEIRLSAGIAPGESCAFRDALSWTWKVRFAEQSELKPLRSFAFEKTWEALRPQVIRAVQAIVPPAIGTAAPARTNAQCALPASGTAPSFIEQAQAILMRELENYTLARLRKAAPDFCRQTLPDGGPAPETSGWRERTAEPEPAGKEVQTLTPQAIADKLSESAALLLLEMLKANCTVAGGKSLSQDLLSSRVRKGSNRRGMQRAWRALRKHGLYCVIGKTGKGCLAGTQLSEKGESVARVLRKHAADAVG
jgi:hypothetical protein